MLYGGAAGGGKSHLMRAAFIIFCASIPGLQAYLFRRVFDDLIKNHMEGPKGFRALLAPWTDQGLVTIVEKEIRFWNGSRIFLCHCQHDDDRFKYQGAEIHLLGVDELTHFTEIVYRFLRSRVRAVGIAVPAQYAGMFPRIMCSSNPGNVGHGWVKEAFVDRGPFEIWQTPDEEGGMMREFIPAKLDDNPSMGEDDPMYRARLRGLGSPELVKAMEDGDWNVIAGAFFPEIGAHHALTPLELPEHWTRFRSFDWGSAKPFSVGWWAVSDGTDGKGNAFKAFNGRGEQVTVPSGALIRYREWYGKQSSNVGLRMQSAEVARGIRSRQFAGENISYSVADPAIFDSQDGPPVAENMAKAGVIFSKADNRRVTGWQQVRDRLIGDDGKPMLYVFTSCLDWWRTVPLMQSDERKPEDIDTDLEDHAADEMRYGCMSRPYTRTITPIEKPRDITQATLNELWSLHDRDKGRHQRI